MSNRSHRRLVAVTALAVASAALAHAPALAQNSVDPRLRIETAASNLSTGFANLISAWCFVDADTILIARRSDGVIRRLDLTPGQISQPGAVVHDLDILAPTPTDSQSEYGVQSITLHPQFATNGWVYIRYSKRLASTPAGQDTPQSQTSEFASPMDNVTERYIWNPAGNAGAGSLTFNATIRTARTQTRYHHGGPSAFTHDGKLITLHGDQRLTNDIAFNGGTQSFFPDVSVVTRLNDDGTTPSDNPFVVAGAPAFAHACFAYGVRNPFGLAIDPLTGRLWITDNGEASFDEINLVPAGANCGANDFAGPSTDPRQSPPANVAALNMIPGAAYVEPQFSFLQTCGVTGIAFLAGSSLGPTFERDVLVGNYNSGLLWRMRLNAERSALVFQNATLQSTRVDSRQPFSRNPVGTPAEENLLATGVGGAFTGVLGMAVSPGPAALPYVLCANGRLYRITRSCWSDVADTDGQPGADGVIDNGDFSAFFVAFFAPEGSPERTPADVANTDGDPGPDGAVDNGDFTLFFQQFFGGC